jgi:hypothetical protein
VIRLIEIKKYSKEDCEGEYIGRFNYYYGLKSSPLKNPYSGQNTYESKLHLINRFKKFLKSLTEDSMEWKEIRRLQKLYKDKGELTLLCWCDPLPCHGEVIKSAILGEIEPSSN